MTVLHSAPATAHNNRTSITKFDFIAAQNDWSTVQFVLGVAMQVIDVVLAAGFVC